MRFASWLSGRPPLLKRSLNQPLHKLAIPSHIGEPLLAALEEIGQLAVVQAEQLQDGRVQVVDVDAVLRGTQAELVGGADDLAAPDAAVLRGIEDARPASSG
jgi:hypothetical protein